MNPYLKSRWCDFKRRLYLEWQVLKMPVVYPVILVTALVQFFHNASHNLIHHLAGVYNVYGGEEETLVDLGFKALENLPSMSRVPNDSLTAVVLITCLTVLSILFTNFLFCKPDFRLLQALWRACIVCSISVLLRIGSFMGTILPSPAEHCSIEEFEAPETAYEILFHFDTGKGCSDLVFSSHLLYGLVATCSITHYLIFANKGYVLTKYQTAAKYSIIFAVWFTVLLEAFAIVRQTRHYTVDVFTCLYAVPFTWIVVLYFIPNDPEPSAEAGLVEKEALRTVSESTAASEIIESTV